MPVNSPAVIDIRLLREKPDEVRAGYQRLGTTVDLDAVMARDTRVRDLKNESQTLTAVGGEVDISAYDITSPSGSLNGVNWQTVSSQGHPDMAALPGPEHLTSVGGDGDAEHGVLVPVEAGHLLACFQVPQV